VDANILFLVDKKEMLIVYSRRFIVDGRLQDAATINY